MEFPKNPVSGNYCKLSIIATFSLKKLGKKWPSYVFGCFSLKVGLSKRRLKSTLIQLWFAGVC